MSALQGLQQEFQRFILTGATTIVQRVAGDERVDPARRLGIYFDAYRLRLVEALQSDYSALLTVVGESDFEQLARQYIDATPSVHRNLRWYGQSLPAFLRAATNNVERPWLADLADFEWTISLAFDAADQVSLTFEQLAGMEPSLWPVATFDFHPSLQVLELATNAPALRKAIDEGTPAPEPEKLAESVSWLLWRKDLTVLFRSLSPAEVAALAQARRRQLHRAVRGHVRMGATRRSRRSGGRHVTHVGRRRPDRSGQRRQLRQGTASIALARALPPAPGFSGVCRLRAPPVRS